MFGKLFGRQSESLKHDIEENSNPSEVVSPFETLVLAYLEYSGIDSCGNSLNEKRILSEKDIERIDSILEYTGFLNDGAIETLILQEWQEQKANNPNLTPVIFAPEFIEKFHNTKFEKFVPDYVLNRNKNLKEAYSDILITIHKIQGFLDHEELRTKIESDFRNNPFVKSRIFQCVTPFCILSLGCDEMGRYSIVYSIDHRIRDMISSDMTSTLLRRIYEFTPGGMEPFVRIGSLDANCIDTFDQLIEQSKSDPSHKIIMREKNGLE